jgi:hypothetical protein
MPAKLNQLIAGLLIAALVFQTTSPGNRSSGETSFRRFSGSSSLFDEQALSAAAAWCRGTLSAHSRERVCRESAGVIRTATAAGPAFSPFGWSLFAVDTHRTPPSAANDLLRQAGYSPEDAERFKDMHIVMADDDAHLLENYRTTFQSILPDNHLHARTDIDEAARCVADLRARGVTDDQILVITDLAFGLEDANTKFREGSDFINELRLSPECSDPRYRHKLGFRGKILIISGSAASEAALQDLFRQGWERFRFAYERKIVPGKGQAQRIHWLRAVMRSLQSPPPYENQPGAAVKVLEPLEMSESWMKAVIRREEWSAFNTMEANLLTAVEDLISGLEGILPTQPAAPTRAAVQNALKNARSIHDGIREPYPDIYAVERDRKLHEFSTRAIFARQHLESCREVLSPVLNDPSIQKIPALLNAAEERLEEARLLSRGIQEFGKALAQVGSRSPLSSVFRDAFTLESRLQGVFTFNGRTRFMEEVLEPDQANIFVPAALQFMLRAVLINSLEAYQSFRVSPSAMGQEYWPMDVRVEEPAREGSFMARRIVITDHAGGLKEIRRRDLFKMMGTRPGQPGRGLYWAKHLADKLNMGLDVSETSPADGVEVVITLREPITVWLEKDPDRRPPAYVPRDETEQALQAEAAVVGGKIAGSRRLEEATLRVDSEVPSREEMPSAEFWIPYIEANEALTRKGDVIVEHWGPLVRFIRDQAVGVTDEVMFFRSLEAVGQQFDLHPAELFVDGFRMAMLQDAEGHPDERKISEQIDAYLVRLSQRFVLPDTLARYVESKSDSLSRKVAERREESMGQLMRGSDGSEDGFEDSRAGATPTEAVTRDDIAQKTGPFLQDKVIDAWCKRRAKLREESFSAELANRWRVDAGFVATTNLFGRDVVLELTVGQPSTLTEGAHAWRAAFSIAPASGAHLEEFVPMFHNFPSRIRIGDELIEDASRPTVKERLEKILSRLQLVKGPSGGPIRCPLKKDELEELAYKLWKISQSPPFGYSCGVDFEGGVLRLYPAGMRLINFQGRPFAGNRPVAYEPFPRQLNGETIFFEAQLASAGRARLDRLPLVVISAQADEKDVRDLDRRYPEGYIRVQDDAANKNPGCARALVDPHSGTLFAHNIIRLMRDIFAGRLVYIAGIHIQDDLRRLDYRETAPGILECVHPVSLFSNGLSARFFVHRKETLNAEASKAAAPVEPPPAAPTMPTFPISQAASFEEAIRANGTEKKPIFLGLEGFGISMNKKFMRRDMTSASEPQSSLDAFDLAEEWGDQAVVVAHGVDIPTLMGFVKEPRFKGIVIHVSGGQRDRRALTEFAKLGPEFEGRWFFIDKMSLVDLAVNPMIAFNEQVRSLASGQGGVKAQPHATSNPDTAESVRRPLRSAISRALAREWESLPSGDFSPASYQRAIDMLGEEMSDLLSLPVRASLAEWTPQIFERNDEEVLPWDEDLIQFVFAAAQELALPFWPESYESRIIYTIRTLRDFLGTGNPINYDEEPVRSDDQLTDNRPSEQPFVVVAADDRQAELYRRLLSGREGVECYAYPSADMAKIAVQVHPADLLIIDASYQTDQGMSDRGAEILQAAVDAAKTRHPAKRFDVLLISGASQESASVSSVRQCAQSPAAQRVIRSFQYVHSGSEENWKKAVEDILAAQSSGDASGKDPASIFYRILRLIPGLSDRTVKFGGIAGLALEIPVLLWAVPHLGVFAVPSLAAFAGLHVLLQYIETRAPPADSKQPENVKSGKFHQEKPSSVPFPVKFIGWDSPPFGDAFRIPHYVTAPFLILCSYALLGIPGLHTFWIVLLIVAHIVFDACELFDHGNLLRQFHLPRPFVFAHLADTGLGFSVQVPPAKLAKESVSNFSTGRDASSGNGVPTGAGTGWVGHMPVTDADFINLGLATREKWLLKEVYPEFEDAPFETIWFLMERLRHPRRLPVEIEKQRKPLQDILNFYQGQDKKEAIAELRELTNLAGSFAAIKGRRTPERFKKQPLNQHEPMDMFGRRRNRPVRTGLHRILTILRQRHYPKYVKASPKSTQLSELWSAFGLESDGLTLEWDEEPDPTETAVPEGKRIYWNWLMKHQEPYPDYTVGLIYIMALVSELIRLENRIPDFPGQAGHWKQKIRAVLERPELKPFLDAKDGLDLVDEYPNPYLFCTKETVETRLSEYRDRWGVTGLHDFARADPGRIMEQALKIQETLATEGKLARIQDQLAGLSRHFSDLGELIDPPPHPDPKHRARQEKTKSRAYKHDYLRQFAEGLMQGPLGELDYYARLAIGAIERDEKFATMPVSPGIVHLDHFNSPILGTTPHGKPVVPITVHLGGDQRSLPISGPNMGGKTVTARSVAIAVLRNQAGQTLSADESSMLSIFRNIYTVFPHPDQFRPGYGYFESLLSELKEVQAKAGPGDLVILDEVPTGTDYKELVAVATVIIEDLHNNGATVIVTGHLKKCFELLHERTGQQPYMQTVRLENGEVVPTYELEPGIARNSHAIELMNKAGFPSRVVDRARAYYRAITEGGDFEAIPSGPISGADKPVTGGKNQEHPTADPLTETVLARLANNFVFESTPENVLNVLKEEDHLAKELRGHGVEIGDEPDERLRLTGVFVAQGAPWLESLSKRLVQLLPPQELRSFTRTSPSFDMGGIRKSLDQMEQSLRQLVEHLQPLNNDLAAGPMVRSLDEYFAKIGELRNTWADAQSEAFGEQVRRSFADADLPVPNPGDRNWENYPHEVLEDLYKESKAELQSLREGIVTQAALLDEFSGIAQGVIKHELKQPVLTDEPHIFVMRDALPFKGKYSTLDAMRAAYAFIKDLPFSVGPYLDKPVRQSVVVDPSNPVMVIRGPNSSGKTVGMMTASINARLALKGFYTSGDLTISRYDRVETFFGGQNVTETGESYFMNILNQYADILRRATSGSFVILDELHGTDYFEIAAIQLAMLQALREKGATVIFNTHILDGLKQTAQTIGMDFWKTDIRFDPSLDEPVQPLYTLSRDPELKAESHGLDVARKWLTEDQYRRAREILKTLDEEEGAHPASIFYRVLRLIPGLRENTVKLGGMAGLALEIPALLWAVPHLGIWAVPALAAFAGLHVLLQYIETRAPPAHSKQPENVKSGEFHQEKPFSVPFPVKFIGWDSPPFGDAFRIPHYVTTPFLILCSYTLLGIPGLHTLSIALPIVIAHIVYDALQICALNIQFRSPIVWEPALVPQTAMGPNFGGIFAGPSFEWQWPVIFFSDDKPNVTAGAGAYDPANDPVAPSWLPAWAAALGKGVSEKHNLAAAVEDVNIRFFPSDEPRTERARRWFIVDSGTKRVRVMYKTAANSWMEWPVEVVSSAETPRLQIRSPEAWAAGEARGDLIQAIADILRVARGWPVTVSSFQRLIERHIQEIGHHRPRSLSTLRRELEALVCLGILKKSHRRVQQPDGAHAYTYRLVAEELINLISGLDTCLAHTLRQTYPALAVPALPKGDEKVSPVRQAAQNLCVAAGAVTPAQHTETEMAQVDEYMFTLTELHITLNNFEHRWFPFASALAESKELRLIPAGLAKRFNFLCNSFGVVLAPLTCLLMAPDAILYESLGRDPHNVNQQLQKTLDNLDKFLEDFQPYAGTFKPLEFQGLDEDVRREAHLESIRLYAHKLRRVISSEPVIARDINLAEWMRRELGSYGPEEVHCDEDLPIITIDEAALFRALNGLDMAIWKSCGGGDPGFQATVSVQPGGICISIFCAKTREPVDLNALRETIDGKRKAGLWSREGMGLRVSGRAVKTLGGIISVDSSADRAICFTVTLPNAPAAAPEMERLTVQEGATIPESPAPSTAQPSLIPKGITRRAA